MNNKKKILFVSILLMVIVSLGIAYGIYSYSKGGTVSSQLVVGDIYMRYNNGQEKDITILLSDTYRSGDYYEFSITGKNTSSKDIIYSIELSHGEEENNKIRLADKYLRFRLVQVENVGEEDESETEIWTNRNYDTIERRIVQIGTIDGGTTSYNITYRLYIWVQGVVVGNIQGYNYSASDWEKVYANIKVDVTGDFEEKTNAMNALNVNRTGINEIRFVRLTSDELQARYDAADVTTGHKYDLTYNNEGKVLSWSEVDPLDNTRKILYIGSNGKTYLTTGGSLFGGFTSVDTIDFGNVDTSRVTTMASMFNGLTNLTTLINLNVFDTSNVQSMTQMFLGCSSLTTLDLSKFDTSNVTLMNSMFYNDYNLQNLNLSGLGSDNLTTIDNIFSGCSGLKAINMSNFNFGTITDLHGDSGSSNKSPFVNSYNVETVDLSNAKMNNAQNINKMFYNNSKLTNINMSNIDMSGVQNMSYMFQNCSSLASVNLSGLGSDSLTNVSSMFSGCSALKTINMSNFNFGSITTLGGDSGSPFYNLSNIETINLNNANMSSVKDMRYLFNGCSSLSNLTLSNINMSSVENMGYIFSGCSSLESINLSGLGSNNLTSFGGAGFSVGMTNVKTIDMSFFNFGKAGTEFMFANAKNAETINLNHANMSQLSSITYMFDGSSSLPNLKNIYLQDVDTSNITNMYATFRNCSGLKTLDLSSFDTSNLANMEDMFRGCTSLETLDLSSFDTNKVTRMHNMFNNNSSLKTIYVSNKWTTSLLSTNGGGGMFYGCTSLKGGNGTTFDGSKTNAEMAVIDTPSTPGYLTLKSN